MAIDKINDLTLHNRALSAELHAAAMRVIDSGWYAMGPEVKAFEQAFARYCGTADAIGVGNGTEAIELSLRAVGVGPGDEVLTVANAGFYSSTAIRSIGAVPAYVDILDDTLLMDPAAAAAAITPRTKAVVVTHLFGRLAEMEPFQALAKRHGIALIEDCAQSHGALRGGRRAGSFGDLAAFSFFPTKNLGALGDGGAVTTSDPALAARVRSLRQYGWSTKYTVVDGGARNSRLDELQAALLAVKLAHLDGWNARRRAIAARYAARIDHPRVRTPQIDDDSHVAHLYVLRCTGRDALKAWLASQGIGTDIHYPVPDHRQPVQGAAAAAAPALPVTERAAGEILTLPCYPELTLDEVDTIAAAVNRWVA